MYKVKRDIVLDIIEKKNKPKKAKPIKMNQIFQTKNSKVIYRPKATISQVLNDSQKVQMDKLIRKHKSY